jgi:BirA family transcriptional regulator, biotin operon repressor / biotin---[acetyl-CoA-carboxylase] ligase
MPSSMIRKLNALLKTDTLGKVIHYFNQIESTNTALFELASKGASEGTTVIADTQTGGKGRLGRTWVSPGGCNLYLSVLFRPGVGAPESTLLTLVASIALYECLKKTGIKDPAIKWPNDILIERRKAAGVLTEMKPEGDRAEFVVAGIGLNVNMSRALINREMADFARHVTSVSENLGREVDRAKLAADLLYELEQWYGKMGTRGRPYILKEWTKRWGGLNQKVRVSIEGQDVFHGIAQGIDGNGHLLVKRENEEITEVISGDISVI